jgi:two-component system chemotaxis response regulator CheB
MSIRVLIVDDSSFICKRVQDTLEEEQDFKVVGIARNGLQALEMAIQLKPDVITMDVEMPVMDGITAVKKIMAISPTPILMFSALTRAGAQATFDALDAGAIDFLPKQLEEIDGNREIAKSIFRRRLRTVALQANRAYKHVLARQPIAVKSHVIKDASSTRTRRAASQCDLLTIIASTGGPVAIQKVLGQVSQRCSIPILLVQHMPGSFTTSFAARLDQLCSIPVREAADGDQLESGIALLAPGGMQMEIKNKGRRHMIALREKTQGEIYSPSADITLTSIAENFSNKVLTVVLTGMGSDGKEGAAKLKGKGAMVWAQDEASCTIYGMPKAIVNADLADEVYSLDRIVQEISRIN